MAPIYGEKKDKQRSLLLDCDHTDCTEVSKKLLNQPYI